MKYFFAFQKKCLWLRQHCIRNGHILFWICSGQENNRKEQCSNDFDIFQHQRLSCNTRVQTVLFPEIFDYPEFPGCQISLHFYSCWLCKSTQTTALCCCLSREGLCQFFVNRLIAVYNNTIIALLTSLQTLKNRVQWALLKKVTKHNQNTNCYIYNEKFC